jgi:hypothetical protein
VRVSLFLPLVVLRVSFLPTATAKQTPSSSPPAVAGIVRGYSTNGAPMSDFPLSAIDRKIDALGAENRIHSEGDVGAYVDALLEKFQLDENKLPGLVEFRSRLINSELFAVLNSGKRIPESLVGRVFNGLMDEWQMPAWTRVSPREVHAFRVNMSLALYPDSVSRLRDGNLPLDCRPVEALYLIYLLHANMGVPSALRDSVRSGRLPVKDPRTLPEQGVIGLHQSKKSSAEIQRLREYSAALSAYFTAHPDFKPQDEVARLFVRLGIQ